MTVRYQERGRFAARVKAWRVTVGKNIAYQRKKRGWTTHELSRQSGLAQSGIWKAETGQKSMSLDTIILLAEAFGISPATLFREEG